MFQFIKKAVLFFFGSGKEEVNQSNVVQVETGDKETTNSNFDEYLDCTEMLCPKPIFEISKKIKVMTANQVLKVECRDAAFKADIEAWTNRMNCGLDLSKDNAVFTAYVTKRN